MLFSCRLLSRWTWITQNHPPSIPKLAAQAPNPTPWKCCRPCQRLRCQKLRTSPLSRSLGSLPYLCCQQYPQAYTYTYIIMLREYGVFIYNYIYTTRINDNRYIIYVSVCVSENVTRRLGNSVQSHPQNTTYSSEDSTWILDGEKLILQGWVSIHGHLLHG